MTNIPNIGRPTPAPGEQLLPFYIVCDESHSMDFNGGIDAINSGLPDLHAAIASDPLVNDKARICLISFSDTAEVLVPLLPAADIEELPGMMKKNATSYGAAFRLLKTQIAIDIDKMKADGYKVLRPAVFFISDGEPTDSGYWEDDHADLVNKTTNPQAPNIIAFGVDKADRYVMKKVATVAAFMAMENVNPGAALKEIMRSLTASIVASASAAKPTMIIPPAPEGTFSLPLDTMDE
jgi:uncharacterized protein YegL